jgi:hypothetical protein
MGADNLSRNVGRELLLYVAYTQRSVDLIYIAVETWNIARYIYFTKSNQLISLP